MSNRTTEPMLAPHRWRLIARDFGDLRERRIDATAGKVVGVLIWEEECGEGEVLIHPNWMGSDVACLDALSDWIGLLDREYESRLTHRDDEPAGESRG